MWHLDAMDRDVGLHYSNMEVQVLSLVLWIYCALWQVTLFALLQSDYLNNEYLIEVLS